MKNMLWLIRNIDRATVDDLKEVLEYLEDYKDNLGEYSSQIYFDREKNRATGGKLKGDSIYENTLRKLKEVINYFDSEEKYEEFYISYSKYGKDKKYDFIEELVERSKTWGKDNVLGFSPKYYSIAHFAFFHPLDLEVDDLDGMYEAIENTFKHKEFGQDYVQIILKDMDFDTEEERLEAVLEAILLYWDIPY